jgi:hypothetical protein
MKKTYRAATDNIVDRVRYLVGLNDSDFETFMFRRDDLGALLSRLDKAEQDNSELRYLHGEICKHVCPGSCDSVEAMLEIVKQRDELRTQLADAKPKQKIKQKL